MSNSIEFTAESLPKAIRALLEANNYEIAERVHVNGAEIDLVATSKSDPFSQTIYIEATVEYVNNTKYGKDATKFLLVRERDASSVCLSVSSEGFTPEVKERASASRIKTMTYFELFRAFEKFSPYVDKILGDLALVALEQVYEEPHFEDAAGKHLATEWLTQWATEDNSKPWIIVLGEYGTGKTALMRILQRRLLKSYQQSPNEKIPLRIELRDFSRQFDARTLLHHFLDTNGLSHVPIDFLLQLIRGGRVILLLDGYDEMAQFLNVRERRACLGALADLASGGAKGILTSRPNYFTESEELHVFEALYQMLDQQQYGLAYEDRVYIEEERRLDVVLEKYILERYERILRDLSEQQTRSLIERKLAGDEAGQRVVLSVVNSVFRLASDGVRQSLAGKPVIVTFLLDLVADIQDNRREMQSIQPGEWTEFRVYKLIVDKLMLRDQRRTPGILPSLRRECLQLIAIQLSTKDVRVADEAVFYDVIDRRFKAELRGLDPNQQNGRRQELFDNLRSSATLTRSEDRNNAGWLFSHNSLREYLVAEHYINSMLDKSFIEFSPTVSDAMRAFAGSMSSVEFSKCVDNLAGKWPERASNKSLGKYLDLLWDGLIKSGSCSAVDVALRQVCGAALAIDNATISNIRVDATNTMPGALTFNAANCHLVDVKMSDINLQGSRFDEGILDSVSFSQCDLRGASFNDAWLFECEIVDCLIRGASFLRLANDSTIYVDDSGGRIRLQGKFALGYLSYHGAITEGVPDFYVLCNHPKFKIIQKVVNKLAEQAVRDIRGLTQRGAAQSDPPFARAFLDTLLNNAVVELMPGGEAARVTPEGRQVLADIQHGEMPMFLAEFLRGRPE